MKFTTSYIYFLISQALFYAEDANNPEIFKILIEAGAEINNIDVRGNDVKYYAQINEHIEILQLLPEIESEVTPEDLLDKTISLEDTFQYLKDNKR